MNILALDTSTDACSVALRTDKDTYTRFNTGARRHGAVILNMIQEVLTEAALSRNALQGIAYTQGPGSFTGLRMTASITQALALVYALPVVPASTLQLIAQCAYNETQQDNILVIQDAHMGEVYWGCYQREETTGFMQVMVKDQLSAPERVNLPEGDWYGVGNAWQTYPDVFSGAINTPHDIVYPHARDLVDLTYQKFENGQTQTAAQVMPVYLRSERAWKSIDQQGVK